MTLDQDANLNIQNGNSAAVADIVIVGGGPVGLLTACLLSETGLKIVLISADQEVLTIPKLKDISRIPDFDARVSALTVASENLLASVGAWKTISSVRTCPYQDMKVWDGEGTGSIHFAAADIHAEALGHIVENRLVTSALNELALTRQNLDLMQGVSVQEIYGVEPSEKQQAIQVGLKLSTDKHIYTRLLIGADGANSVVREQMGFSLRQWDYGHQAIVTTVLTE